MKKENILLKHIKMFLLTLFLLVATIVIGLRITILSRSFALRQFSAAHYQKVEKNIKEEMKDSMISSGLDDTIIDTMFTSSDVRNTTEQTIDIIYNYHNQKLDTTVVQNNLERNIKANLEKKHYKIENEKDYQKFVDSMMKIYKKEFTMLNQVTRIGKYMKILIKVTSLASILLFTLFMILLMIRRKTIKKLLPVPFLTTAFLLLFGTWYINKEAGLSSITIFSKTFSEILRSMIQKTFLTFNIIAILYITIAIILHLFFIHHRKRHRHHNYEEV